MRTTVLERVNVQERLEALREEEAELELLSGRVELAERAAEELGYDVLKKKIEERDLVEQKSSTECQVLQTLSEVGPDAVPYKPELVEKYKDEMVRMDMPFLLRHRNWKAPERLVTFFAGALVVSIIVSLTGMAIQVFSYQWFALLLCGIAGLLNTAICFIAFNLTVDTIEYKPIGWNRHIISEYPEQIPEFVLETALSVKERLPEAEFCIDSFVKNEGVGCPFLVMCYQRDEYYLEVWNEPKFKAQRLA